MTELDQFFAVRDVLARTERIDRILDHMLRVFDNWFCSGEFAVANEALKRVDIRKCCLGELVGYLTCASWARDKLPYRETFYAAVEAKVIEFEPKQAERILEGLK